MNGEKWLQRSSLTYITSTILSKSTTFFAFTHKFSKMAANSESGPVSHPSLRPSHWQVLLLEPHSRHGIMVKTGRIAVNVVRKDTIRLPVYEERLWPCNILFQVAFVTLVYRCRPPTRPPDFSPDFSLDF